MRKVNFFSPIVKALSGALLRLTGQFFPHQYQPITAPHMMITRRVPRGFDPKNISS